MEENEHTCQVFIRIIFGLNLLMIFCGNYLLIILITSTKFYKKKRYLFNFQTRPYRRKSNGRSIGE